MNGMKSFSGAKLLTDSLSIMSSTNWKFNSILPTCCGFVDSVEDPEGMEQAVSVSIGSSKRNKSVEVELLGEKVLIERIGTDGWMKKQPSCTVGGMAKWMH